MRKKRTTKQQTPPKTSPLKVAIIGKAPDTIEMAPYDDPTWEIWGLSNVYEQIPRWSRWFELHEYDAGKARWPKGYTDWLGNRHDQRPIYCHAADERIPNGVAYPWRQILERFPRRYFNNSVSWMIALAISSGAVEIGLYGVNMAQFGAGQANEYGHQRPSCEYMIGLAEGAGIRVTIPAESDLLKCGQLYALDTHRGAWFVKMQARKKELQAQLAPLQQQAQAAHDRGLLLRGALDEQAYQAQWAESQPST